jgi:GNAT superfamily N-acetyltransferase
VTADRLEVRLVEVTDLGAAELLAELVNAVYDVGEAGLWRDGVTRTSEQELAESIEGQLLAGAWLDTELVGCVRLRVIDGQTAELGMLSARSDLRGIGIGRALIDFAESWARAAGFERMQLELLKPRGWEHPAKELLHAWYRRLGYVVVSTEDFVAVVPDVEQLLAVPCDFLVFWKQL